MVYLVIKELSTVAEDVIMVTSSIMKDMQSNLDVIYRPNAIRALARIIDVSIPMSAWKHFLSSARLNPYNLSNDSSNPPSSIGHHPSPPLPSFPHITSSTSHPPLSSDGRTKLRKLSTRKLYLPLRTADPRRHTSAAEGRGAIRR